MRILLSASDYTNLTNGLARSARDFCQGLRERGHEVKVLSYGEESSLEYPLPELRIPILNAYIHAQHFRIARPDLRAIKAALQWADIVYVEDPLPANAVLVREARRARIPVVGSFHVYPENFLAPFPALNRPSINHALYSLFYSSVYSACDCIHAPTQAVKERLERFGYKVPIEAFSNGLPNAWIRTGLPSSSRGEFETSQAPHRFTVVSTGRYAPEKNHEVLLRALAYSRHAPAIDLYLPGRGPLENNLRRLASPLATTVHFGFFSHEDLQGLLDRADLYIHCARVEIEGLAALEAMARGVTPLIARSEESSTWRYAQDERCVFPYDNPVRLARLIDYWLDRPCECRDMGMKHYEQARELSMTHSIDAMESLLVRTYRSYTR